MSELLANLALGFSVAANPYNIGFCLLGALVGTLVGVLPGIGTVATVAMLLPITFGLPPVGALIMLAGIYYGAQYGGSTTSILVNIPGEATSVVTCLDGHQMARQGRAGAALAIAAIGSFFAGCVSTVLVAALGAPLTVHRAAVRPGGIFLADVARPDLRGGAGERLGAQGDRHDPHRPAAVDGRLRPGNRRRPHDLRHRRAVRRHRLRQRGHGRVRLRRDHPQPGNVAGKPRHREGQDHGPDADAAGPDRFVRRDRARHHPRLAPRHSAGRRRGHRLVCRLYVRKTISKHPERFGRGAIEGVAAPESANNAAAQTSFIPLLTLGIPPNAVMALMVGAMTIHGIVPGPQVMTKQPELFWGMIASMWLGNLMLVVINLPLVGVWVSLLRVPYRLLYPSIIVFCCIGIYSINNSPTDVVIAAIFGLFGYWLIKHDFEPAPLVLAFVLGPLMEENLRRAMLIARGDATVFLTRPISAGLIAVAAGLLVIAALPMIRKRREEVFVE